MIRYRYKKPKILFVGINPHPGSFRRSVPFSNNKMFWYLLSDAGLLRETRDELRDDVFLMRLYSEAFNPLYRLGFVNIIDRPTRDITEIRKGEELSGRAKIFRFIKTERRAAKLVLRHSRGPPDGTTSDATQTESDANFIYQLMDKGFRYR